MEGGYLLWFSRLVMESLPTNVNPKLTLYYFKLKIQSQLASILNFPFMKTHTILSYTFLIKFISLLDVKL